MAYSDLTQVCQGWIEPTDLCCQLPGTVDDATLILAVSNFLYARTCYRYPGECEISVWPCIECQCNCHPCACGTFRHFELPTDYPILSVDSITIDGTPFTDYRVDRSTWVVRMDGQPWPPCNSFGLPNTTSQEIIVNATVGRPIPPELKLAAADLVCEIKKACNDDATCQLDLNHIKSLDRRGVHLEFEDITQLFGMGLTGVPTVDMAIKIHSNCGGYGRAYDPLTPSRGYGVS